MKIHDILQQAVCEYTDAILRFEQIRALVKAHAPQLKSSSILPSEHSDQATRGSCLRCMQHPIFIKMGRGRYQVCSQPVGLPEKSIHEKLASLLATVPQELISTQEIRQLMSGAFPDTHLPSVILSDHVRGGSCKICSDFPLFGHSGTRGLYRILKTQTDTAIHTASLSQRLGQLLKQYDLEQIFAAPELLHQALLDWQGQERRRVNLLELALRERIPLDLLEFGDLMSPESLQQRLIQRLYLHYGIAPEWGSEAVTLWKQALDRAQRRPRHVYSLPSSQARVAESTEGFGDASD
ncbi:MAG: hypothetical protein ACO1RX_21390 [Candidatus Sericytochromatia bacterium]